MPATYRQVFENNQQWVAERTQNDPQFLARLAADQHVLKMAVVQNAFLKGGTPQVHGWVYDLHDGLLKDLHVDTAALLEKIRAIYALSPE